MTKKTESPIVFDAQVEKPKVKRPRSGSWVKTSRQIPIPGTESDTADLDMYRVEFAGETLEVQRNRAGVKKATAWIRGMKERASQGLKIDRIRKSLLELAEEADEETAGRLRSAAETLQDDDKPDGKEEGR